MKRFLLSLIAIGLTSSVLAEGTPVDFRNIITNSITNILATTNMIPDVSNYVTQTELNIASNNIVSQIPDVSGYALDTNVVHASFIKTGNYYNVDTSISFNGTISGKGVAGIICRDGDPNNGRILLNSYENDNTFIRIQDSESLADLYPNRIVYNQNVISYPTPVEDKYIALTSNPDGSLDLDLSQYVTATQVSNIVDSIINYMVDVGGITRNGTNYVLVIQPQELP